MQVIKRKINHFIKTKESKIEEIVLKTIEGITHKPLPSEFISGYMHNILGYDITDYHVENEDEFLPIPNKIN